MSRVFFALLTVSLLCEAQASGQCQASSFVTDKGSQAGKYKQISAASAGDCCKLCAADPKCGHFTFVPPSLSNDYFMEAVGECKLKKGGIPGYVEHKGYITGQPGGAPGPSPAPPAPIPPAPGPPPPGPQPGPALGFRPHLIYMLADDFGHYNMGWRGNKEARTPHMDSLVAEGLVLDRMYVYQYCSPTRSSLLSGRFPIHVNEANRGPTAKGGVDLRMTIIAEKLKDVGYSTHQVGKWNAGSLAWGQLPYQRGFDSSYGYMSGEEDHYSQIGGYSHGVVDLWDTDQPAYGKNGTYNAFRFTERALNIIQAHDPSTPLFMYLAWQNTHTPNEVPSEFLGPKLPNDLDTKHYFLRQTYEAMAHCLDSGIGNVTNALKAKGMWDKTLVIFSSDNGGREDATFGGNNFPLRGMKFTDFEGGTRVASWASGGIIPAKRRGGVEAGLTHVCDWYATFCALAGADPWDEKAKQAGLPPVDSMNMWPMLQSGSASPRTVVPLSSHTVIAWPYKLIMGTQGGKGWYTSMQHPNSTGPIPDHDSGCPGVGCLFNIEKDPEERNDLASTYAEILQNLTGLLESYKATKFQTSDIPGYDDCTSEKDYVKEHHGFGGPLCNKSKAVVEFV